MACAEPHARVPEGPIVVRMLHVSCTLHAVRARPLHVAWRVQDHNQAYRKFPPVLELMQGLHAQPSLATGSFDRALQSDSVSVMHRHENSDFVKSMLVQSVPSESPRYHGNVSSVYNQLGHFSLFSNAGMSESPRCSLLALSSSASRGTSGNTDGSPNLSHSPFEQELGTSYYSGSRRTAHSSLQVDI